MAMILVNIGPGNGLVPYGTKQLPQPILNYHQWDTSNTSQLIFCENILDVIPKNAYRLYFENNNNHCGWTLFYFM